MAGGICLNFDDAWDTTRLSMPVVDCRFWGPQLRYAAPERTCRRALDALSPQLGDEAFILYGSGDFHHLAALWLSRCLQRHSQCPSITLVSFDNHPDWDIRPPRWACGNWINRALEIPQLQHAAVWGCGNFELAFPNRLFRNRAALASGRLAIHAWAERQSSATTRRFNCMSAANWRQRFSRFAEGLRGGYAYVTIDMDCLSAPHACTNWENGLFVPDDLAWALAELRRHSAILGGDLCGACSPEHYARPFQRLIARLDHPKIAQPPLDEVHRRNHCALDVLWPALVSS